MSKVSSLKKQIKQLEGELDDAKENQQLKCPSCMKRTRIKNLTVLQNEWYEDPKG